MKRTSEMNRQGWLTQLAPRRVEFADRPVYLAIMESMVPQGIDPPAPRPITRPYWLASALLPQPPGAERDVFTYSPADAIARGDIDMTYDFIVRGWDPEKKESIAARGPRQTVSLDGTFSPGFGRKGWDGTIKGRKFEDDSTDLARCMWDHDVLDFATKVVDPNRNVTTAAYDATGNCIAFTHVGRLLDGSDSPLENLAYNSYGQLIGRTNSPDANGYRRVDTAQYYSSGPQAGYCATWVVDTQGPVVTITTYEYDSRGNVTRCVDPRGNDCLWTYNAMDQCVRFESPTNIKSRCVTDISYDANDNVLSTSVDVRDDTDTKLGTKSRFRSYDQLKRCIADVEQASASHYLTNGYSYDGDDNLVLVQTPQAMNGSDPTM